ncbi:MAG: protoporphyrinogen oxidase [Candidatus Melainabacteria bacterium]|nr:protoporphyrinogen oxidase [Candidatus Melainabacteria bacterium]
MTEPGKKVAVLGAGITGLAAAHRMLAGPDSIELKVFESSDRAGGVIDTFRDESGTVYEGGPDSFFNAKPEALELCRELGLESELIGLSEANRRSLVAHRGRLHPLPEGFVMLAPSRIGPYLDTPLISPLGKARCLMELALPRRLTPGDESVSDFVVRRFGREMLTNVVEPMVGGIYVGDVERLSARAAIPQFVEMEREHGSVIRALMKSRGNGSTAGARYGLFSSLKGGMGRLVDRLVETIGSQRIAFGKEIGAVFRRDSRWSLLDASGAELGSFDAVIGCLPAQVSASLFSEVDRDLSEALSEIQAASSVVINLVFPAGSIESKVEGFGFVIPHNEVRSIIACSFTSNKFPERYGEDVHVLRAFLGGVRNEGVVEKSDDDLVALALGDLRDYLGISESPLISRVRRYRKSMPQYLVGHQERVERIERALAGLPGLFLAGSSYRGVGISDCVRSGDAAALEASRYIQNRCD